MIIKRPNTKGETLAETIIALSILAITITMAGMVILNSMRNMSTAKQRFIAVNIAREGIEAMRNIRDTNWLLYSDRRRLCWNHDPDPANGFCDGNTTIEPGYYVVYKSANGTWQLEFADLDRSADTSDPADGIPDNDIDGNIIKLSLVDISDEIDSDGDGDFENDADMYNHTDAVITDPFGLFVASTPFSRYVIVEYLENQPDPTTSPSMDSAPAESINTLAEWNDFPDTSELNRMRLTSVVEWKRGANRHTVELKTIITDHLGREDLSS